MIRICLPQEESHRLEQAYREETDRKFRDRIQIAYLEQGLDGLRPRQAPGAPAKIPAEMADELKRWVIEGPASQGLDRANWTHQELAGAPGAGFTRKSSTRRWYC